VPYEQDVLVLSAEFKSAAAFPRTSTWYHGSRGLQALGALWSGWLTNPFAPAILLTPQNFKLLLVRDAENSECACTFRNEETEGRRNFAMYQFPSGYACGNTKSPEFIKMLVISILAASPLDDVQSEGDSAEEVECPSLRVSLDPKHPPTPLRPRPRRSARIRERQATVGEPEQGGNGHLANEHCTVPVEIGHRNYNVWFVGAEKLEELELADENSSNAGNYF
jgi:hypothetical protein